MDTIVDGSNANGDAASDFIMEIVGNATFTPKSTSVPTFDKMIDDKETVISASDIESVSGTTFNKAVKITAGDGETITVNGETVDGNVCTLTDAGEYEIVITDADGNVSVSIIRITDGSVNNTAASVAEVTAAEIESGDGMTFGTAVKITADNGETISVNGKKVDGNVCVLDTEGEYTVVVSDSNGNTKTAAITVKPQAVKETVITSSEIESKDGMAYSGSVKITAGSGETITVNGKVMDGNSCVLSDEGGYTVVITDAEGNEKTAAITVKANSGNNNGGGHVHNYVESVTKESTCTESGIKTISCSCGVTKNEVIFAKGHSYGTETVSEEPDCLNGGKKTAECEICGDVKETTISALGHDYDNEANFLQLAASVRLYVMP